MPYELLVHRSAASVEPMSAFLNVSIDDAALKRWTDTIRRSENSKNTWPGPFPRSCDDRISTKIGTLLSESASVVNDGELPVLTRAHKQHHVREVTTPTSSSLVVRQYLAGFSHWFYNQHLYQDAQLLDVVPRHPMSYCDDPE